MAQPFRSLRKGLLALAKLGQIYELVPLATAEKIAQRDPSRAVLLNTQLETPSEVAIAVRMLIAI